MKPYVYLLLGTAFAIARSEIDSLIHLLGHGRAKAMFDQVTSATSRSAMGGRISGSEFLRLFFQLVWGVTHLCGAKRSKNVFLCL